jgi:hypothetical protein
MDSLRKRFTRDEVTEWDGFGPLVPRPTLRRIFSYDALLVSKSRLL